MNMKNKLLLLFWELPKGSIEWILEVHPNGIVAVRTANQPTPTRMEFDRESDIELIKVVLKALGFKESTENV